LRHHCTDQQPAVRSSANDEPLPAGIARRLQILGRGDEIVEYVLLLLAHARMVPGLAVLAASAQVRNREDTALLEPAGDRSGKEWLHRDVEAAIAVEHRWVAVVQRQSLAQRDEDRHAGAVFRNITERTRLVGAGVEGRGGRLERFQAVPPQVVAIDAARAKIRGEDEEEVEITILRA